MTVQSTSIDRAVALTRALQGRVPELEQEAALVDRVVLFGRTSEDAFYPATEAAARLLGQPSSWREGMNAFVDGLEAARVHARAHDLQLFGLGMTDTETAAARLVLAIQNERLTTNGSVNITDVQRALRPAPIADSPSHRWAMALPASDETSHEIRSSGVMVQRAGMYELLPAVGGLPSPAARNARERAPELAAQPGLSELYARQEALLIPIAHALYKSEVPIGDELAELRGFSEAAATVWSRWQGTAEAMSGALGIAYERFEPAALRAHGRSAAQANADPDGQLARHLKNTDLEMAREPDLKDVADTLVAYRDDTSMPLAAVAVRADDYAPDIYNKAPRVATAPEDYRAVEIMHIVANDTALPADRGIYGSGASSGLALRDMETPDQHATRLALDELDSAAIRHAEVAQNGRPTTVNVAPDLMQIEDRAPAARPADRAVDQADDRPIAQPVDRPIDRPDDHGQPHGRGA